MSARWIRVDPAAAMRDGFDAIRREAGVPEAFAAEAEEEARRAAEEVRTDAGGRERVDLDFVTIDPPGARDLDQALHIERRGDGHRVSYAIADVAAFVAPGGAVDREAHARGVTVYAPDEKTPLHPPALSEGAASLLPGEWRPAVLWTLDLDGQGELVDVHVARAQVRSSAQHTYEDVPPDVATVLAEVGEKRLRIERERGGVRLNVPEQEVVREGGSWTVKYRVPLATEEHNAQVSLLTGMAAARLMLDAGVGLLRTQPPPDAKSLARLRRQAEALHVEWREPYPEFIRSLDPAIPAQAALMHEATGVGHGAGYLAFDGEAPPQADATHFAIAAPYAHATAPLRRLQDRFVLECCLAAQDGRPVPQQVHEALPRQPEAMAAGAKRARAVERGVVDLVEAVLLQGREGERFEAVVIDDGLVQLRDPAIRGRLEHATPEHGAPEPGTVVTVTLDRADPATRSIAFSPS